MSSPRVRVHAVAALLLLASLLAPATATTTAAAKDPGEARLEDNEYYYEGTTLVRENYASPNTTSAQLYTASGRHVRDIPLDNGDLRFSTTGLQGDYYVTAPNATRLAFTIRSTGLAVTKTNLVVVDDPARARLTVDISTSVAELIDHPYYVSVPRLHPFSSRVTGKHATAINDSTVKLAQTSKIHISLAGTSPMQFAVHVRNPHTGVTDFIILSVNDTVLTPDADQYTSVSRGDTVWRPAALAVATDTPDRVVTVESLAGDQIARQLTSTSGTLYVSTRGWEPGIYRVLSPSGEELTRFEVKVQTVDARVEDGVLVLSSNRDGYSASVRVANDSRVVTDRVFNTSGNTTTLTDLSTSERVPLSTEGIAPGTYTVTLNVQGASASATASFTVEERQTTTSRTTMSTTARTTTATTTTSTTVQTADTTTSTSTTETTGGGESGGESPGFGVVVGGIAVVAAGLLAARTGDR